MNPAKRFNKWTVTALVVISAASPWLKPEQTSDIQQADALTILALGAIAAAVIAGLLLKPKVDAQKRDQRLPTTAQRGDQLGYVLGRRIVSGPPVWVGRRTSKEERVSGGGKGGPFGGGGPKQIVYYEDGVYAIGLGPGSHLFRIIKNQSKVVFSGPITPDSTPSGSLLHDLEGNAFKIYWGEKFQPINTDLAGDDALGIASRWPYWMYIHWIQYREGTQATWPDLEFDYASTCIGTPLPGSACNFTESAPGANDAGINGAHAIYQLCTGRFPHGGGMDPSHFDFGTLKALGVRIQQERVPQNIQIGGGTTLMDILDDILADLGVFVVQDMDRILFMPIRPESSPPTLNDTIQVIPRAAYDVDHGAEQISNTLFLYPDIENQFYQTDVPANDDATARLFRRKRGQQVTMATITDKTTASVVSQRRKLLYLSDTNQLSLEVMRTARRLVPGQVAIFNGIGQLRVTAIQRLATSGKAKLTAVVDQYALNSGGWNPNTGPGSGGPSTTTPDDAFLVFELPFDLVGRELAIGVVRIRKDGQGVPATVWVSTDGTTYNSLGDQNASAAGFIASEISDKTPAFVGEGPLLIGTTAAAAKVLDLTSSQANWLSGSQLLIFDSECMYLRSISTTSAPRYQAGLFSNQLVPTQGFNRNVGEAAPVYWSNTVNPGTNAYDLNFTVLHARFAEAAAAGGNFLIDVEDRPYDLPFFNTCKDIQDFRDANYPSVGIVIVYVAAANYNVIHALTPAQIATLISDQNALGALAASVGISPTTIWAYDAYWNPAMTREINDTFIREFTPIAKAAMPGGKVGWYLSHRRADGSNNLTLPMDYDDSVHQIVTVYASGSQLYWWCAEGQGNTLQQEATAFPAVYAFTQFGQGNLFKANGIVRKRLSTPRVFHGADSLCGVIAPDSITPFTHNSWGVGMQLWVKCQTQGTDIDDVVPVVLRLKGKALGGPPVSNLTHNLRLAGQDIFFEWLYRVHPGLGAGAGEMPYGEPVEDTTPPEVGYFTIEILNALGISKRVENIGNNTTYTYSAANQVTDGINSGDPFTFRVVHKIDNFGGYDNDLAVPGAI